MTGFITGNVTGNFMDSRILNYQGRSWKDLIATKLFQISISVSLSCLAKERCIPVIAKSEIKRFPTQICAQKTVI
jgi:hypothetical protein